MNILIKIDKRSRRPVFRQIIEQIIGLIESGAIKPGVSLPSTRRLAERLSVNRSTVYKAYQELWSMGYLESTPGAYTRVRDRIKVVASPPETVAGQINWDERSNTASRYLLSTYLNEKSLLDKAQKSDIINFIPLSPDSRLFPLDSFRKCMNQVLISRGNELLQYGDPMGFRPLREYIAGRMRAHSVSITPDEIMITTGAQNAVACILKLMTSPGTRVAVEAPTYARIIDLLRLLGLEPVEITMKQDGMDLRALEKILARESAAIIYTMPNYHNPTGITTTQEHRENLLKLCEQYGVPLIEDGFEEEMKYLGKSVLPIKSMDHGGVVIYVGTFSKVLFPGLRIGWIAADKDLVRRLAPIQKTLILSGNLLDQAAVYQFCKTGHYDLHLKRLHKTYRDRMNAAVKALKAHLRHKQVVWIQPSGGYIIWFVLKNLKKHENQVMKTLLDHGAAVSPGSGHYSSFPRDPCFRISIAHLDEPSIVEGVRRIVSGISELYDKQ